MQSPCSALATCCRPLRAIVDTETIAGSTSVEPCLLVLAHRFMTALMQPRVLRLRRLVMANADRFPHVSRSWYEEGFERVLATLATTFEGLAAQKLLDVDDPLVAANHFVGLLLWIPINRAMYTGEYRSNSVGLERFAVAAVRAFITGYGSSNRTVHRSAQTVSRKNRFRTKIKLESREALP